MLGPSLHSHLAVSVVRADTIKWFICWWSVVFPHLVELLFSLLLLDGNQVPPLPRIFHLIVPLLQDRIPLFEEIYCLVVLNITSSMPTMSQVVEGSWSEVVRRIHRIDPSHSWALGPVLVGSNVSCHIISKAALLTLFLVKSWWNDEIGFVDAITSSRAWAGSLVFQRKWLSPS